eukprot:GHVP01035191.1.p1 GENE.GHVP01035191.1~~GHVP01035191.1.p1  ORF type:complete len:183 (+),score=31.27 GHVP01035191.1:29-577(+)
MTSFKEIKTLFFAVPQNKGMKIVFICSWCLFGLLVLAIILLILFSIRRKAIKTKIKALELVGDDVPIFWDIQQLENRYIKKVKKKRLFKEHCSLLSNIIKELMIFLERMPEKKNDNSDIESVKITIKSLSHQQKIMIETFKDELNDNRFEDTLMEIVSKVMKKYNQIVVMYKLPYSETSIDV